MKKNAFFLIAISSFLIIASIVVFIFDLFFFSLIFSIVNVCILLLSYIKVIFSVKMTTEYEKQIVSGDLTTNILENDSRTATREVLQSTVNNFENIISLQKYASKEFLSICEQIILNIKNNKTSLQEAQELFTLVSQILNGINNSISKANMLSVGISGDIEMLESQILTQVMMIENSSDALNEMTSAINQLDKLSEETNQSAELLLTLSNEGKDAVESSALQIEEIERQANKIEEMVHTIGKISEQTSILAMNAEIEAAHAGDVGKGFAVVADEVRKLAEDSAVSSREIGYFVNDIIELIKNASEASDKTTEAFSQIDKNINGVCSGVDEITKALNLTSQKSNGLLQNIQLVREISDVINSSAQDIFQNAANISECMIEIRDKNNTIEQNTKDNSQNIDSLQQTLEISENGLTSVVKLSEVLNKYSAEYITFEHPEFETLTDL